jgi:hypothetical protein
MQVPDMVDGSHHDSRTDSDRSLRPHNNDGRVYFRWYCFLAEKDDMVEGWKQIAGCC